MQYFIHVQFLEVGGGRMVFFLEDIYDIVFDLQVFDNKIKQLYMISTDNT